MHHMKTPTTSQHPLFVDQKPVRVTVPVPGDVLEAFRRLADVQGVSVGRAMGEWLTDTLDGVNAMTDLVAKARRTPHIAARQLHAYAVATADQAADLLDQVKAKSAVRDAVAGVTRKPAPRRTETPQGRLADFVAGLDESPREGSPPWGNTGGKVPKKTTKVAQKRGGKGS